MKSLKVLVILLGLIILALLAVLIFYPGPAKAPTTVPASSQAQSPSPQAN